ncbi:hypothetical protein EVAR_47750_1 [Eumeta japonica]|uniref:Uncharacterized protein n=1 Tax=Eumeta variegata TaxID=151549 RepID=A0A4C1VX98_EUMVA|nr:hypothetical protein EVAR_47750_1 [Eumeta japonica]
MNNERARCLSSYSQANTLFSMAEEACAVNRRFVINTKTPQTKYDIWLLISLFCSSVGTLRFLIADGGANENEGYQNSRTNFGQSPKSKVQLSSSDAVGRHAFTASAGEATLKSVKYQAHDNDRVLATAERNEAKVSDEKENKKLKKREAILLDGLPESPYVHSSPAKVVYRKASRSRYGKPKSKYGAPKLKHGPPKISRPQKKYKRKPTSKYVPRTAYKRPKTRNAPTKSTHIKRKPYYSPTKTFKEEIYSPPESTGFGEPQLIMSKLQSNKTYAEPPSDAYNTPLINTYHQYPTGQEFSHDQTRQNYYAGPDHPISPGVSAPAHTVNEARPIEDGLLDGQTVNDDYAEQTERFNPKPTIATYPRRILKRKPYTFRSKKALGRNSVTK